MIKNKTNDKQIVGHYIMAKVWLKLQFVLAKGIGKL